MLSFLSGIQWENALENETFEHVDHIEPEVLMKLNQNGHLLLKSDRSASKIPYDGIRWSESQSTGGKLKFRRQPYYKKVIINGNHSTSIRCRSIHNEGLCKDIIHTDKFTYCHYFLTHGSFTVPSSKEESVPRITREDAEKVQDLLVRRTTTDTYALAQQGGVRVSKRQCQNQARNVQSTKLTLNGPRKVVKGIERLKLKRPHTVDSDSGRFQDKVAIITGSSFGIGRQTALLFAKEGAKVTITGRNEERLQGSRQALLDAGIPASNFILVAADITTSSGQDLLISRTLEAFGKLDILINNAGAEIPDKEKRTGIDMGVETFEKTIRLNVQSVIEMTQKTRPHLAKAGGEIVNVSSIVGLKAGWPAPYYPLAKAALDQYTRSCAIDLIKEGIRVNTVNPGVVVTGFHESAGMSSEYCENFYENAGKNPCAIPCGFTGRPEHIASVIAFLADRNQSAYIIGQNIVADGGTTLVLGFHAHMARPPTD